MKSMRETLLPMPMGESMMLNFNGFNLPVVLMLKIKIPPVRGNRDREPNNIASSCMRFPKNTERDPCGGMNLSKQRVLYT